MKREQKDYQLYDRRYDSVESVISYFTRATEHSGKTINLMFLFCKRDIHKISFHPPDDMSVRVDNSHNIIFPIKISTNAKVGKAEHLDALCLQTRLPSVFIILSDCKYSIFKRLFSRLIYFNYPSLSRLFLRDSEIKKLLTSLDTEQNLQILVHRFLSYSRYLERTEEKALIWTRRPYNDVFEELETNNAWIKKIEFRAWKEQIKDEVSYRMKLFDAGITRDCIFTAKGNFDKFYEYIIANSIKMIGERLGYLEERSKTAMDRKPEPIVIKFHQPVFKDEGWNEKFIEDMMQLKNISLNELHTNPYVHISILDYQDGSSYSIWIVSNDEINIVPQFRATIASMSRLVNHIYEKVMEGETTEYAPLEIGRANSS